MGKSVVCKDCLRAINSVGERDVHLDSRDAMAALGTNFVSFPSVAEYARHRAAVHGEAKKYGPRAGSDCDCFSGGWG